MKTAIVYASTHGTTEKVVNMLALKIENAELFNLKKNKKISLDSYHQIIIGGSIHAGSIQRRVKEFYQNNMVKLLQMRVGLFICAMNESEFEKELKQAFPELLRNHAISQKVVGGEFIFEKMNFVEKFLVKKISGVTQTISKLNDLKIMALANDMNSSDKNHKK